MPRLHVAERRPPVSDESPNSDRPASVNCLEPRSLHSHCHPRCQPPLCAELSRPARLPLTATRPAAPGMPSMRLQLGRPAAAAPGAPPHGTHATQDLAPTAAAAQDLLAALPPAPASKAFVSFARQTGRCEPLDSHLQSLLIPPGGLPDDPLHVNRAALSPVSLPPSWFVCESRTPVGLPPDGLPPSTGPCFGTTGRVHLQSSSRCQKSLVGVAPNVIITIDALAWWPNRQECIWSYDHAYLTKGHLALSRPATVPCSRPPPPP